MLDASGIQARQRVWEDGSIPPARHAGRRPRPAARARPRAKPAIRRAGPVPGREWGSPRPRWRRQRARCSASQQRGHHQPRASAPPAHPAPSAGEPDGPQPIANLTGPSGQRSTGMARSVRQSPCGVSASGWNPGPCPAGAGRRIAQAADKVANNLSGWVTKWPLHFGALGQRQHAVVHELDEAPGARHREQRLQALHRRLLIELVGLDDGVDLVQPAALFRYSWMLRNRLAWMLGCQVMNQSVENGS